ncbi:hypothetical protein OsJ_28544 [Oryza sativa Japonica Group]|uniref:RIN4 pathogenic type III effector avirulence factor Avr cleavage site domain-containing protein n=1 Tax=Oryza sativa subsp. japonica TaxID=39947 RepID=A3BWI2_ORYSJ|nr:hypothetical protein OsJ_28544 [Oryza sativa Japonica Group]
MRLTSHCSFCFRELNEKGSPLPKFGEWDVNDPASAEGFTVIFNKARDEKKTGGNSQGQDLAAKSEQPSGQGLYPAKPNSSAILVISFTLQVHKCLVDSAREQVILKHNFTPATLALECFFNLKKWFCCMQPTAAES